MILCWKYISEDYDGKGDFITNLLVVDCEKTSFRASKQLRILGPKKLLKIVNCATIKEIEKMKETMVGAQVELEGGHQYPPGSFLPP